MSTTACTLPTAERPLRLAEFDALFSSSVRRVERDRHHVHLHLSGGPGLSERVRDLAARETECCSFFTFSVAGPDDALILDVSVPAAYGDVLAALADRAQELSA